MNTLRDVTLFHETFNHPVATTPILLGKDRLATRIDWIISELKELRDAVAAGDIIEQADALADARYFLDGTIVEAGMAELFPRIFAEVQRSNMSKACNSLQEVLDTIDFHEPKQGACHWIKKTITDDIFNIDKDIYIVVRTSDGKTMKSINFSPPDLSFIKQ